MSIESKISHLLDEFNLNDKIIGLATLNFNNFSFEYHYCAAHMINLAVMQGIEIASGTLYNGMSIELEAHLDIDSGYYLIALAIYNKLKEY
ncbi:4384_t:CDS:2, partial [Racocetra fulgida]